MDAETITYGTTAHPVLYATFVELIHTNKHVPSYRFDKICPPFELFTIKAATLEIINILNANPVTTPLDGSVNVTEFVPVTPTNIFDVVRVVDDVQYVIA